MMKLATYFGCGALILGLAGVAAAQPPPPPGEPGRRAGAPQDDTIVRQGQVAADVVYKRQSIVGMPVRNAASEDLGEIQELVVEPRSGQIRYAALSFGGFLGLGDKLFAVPWGALTLKHGEEETFFVLNVPEEKLENAPGFDSDSWPNTASAEFRSEIDRYYGDFPSQRQRERTGRQPVRQPQEANAAGGRSSSGAVYKSGDLVGMEVRNSASEDSEELGEIEELVFNLNRGEIGYAALSFGGFLGLGDKLFAIPWDEFSFQQGAGEDDEKYLVLRVAPEKLKEAPGFDSDEWPEVADPNWRQQIDRYYDGDDAEETSTVTRPRAN